MGVFFKRLLAQSLEAAKRFKLAILFAFVATLASLFLIWSEGLLIGHKLLKENVAKVWIVSLLAVALFAAIKLLQPRISAAAYKIVLGFAFASLLFYFFILHADLLFFEMQRHIFLIIAFVIAILWVPFWGVKVSNKEYWSYAKETISAFEVAARFSLILLLGVYLALFAIHALFEVHISHRVYESTLSIASQLFFTSYFLSQIPKKPLQVKSSSGSTKWERFATYYILTPLTLFYFLILFSYTAKVLITLDWPKGMLAWMIVGFSVVAIFTYLYWTHFIAKEQSKWRKLLWFAVLLQTVMLFIAVGFRVTEYSWSINRYMVVAFGVWLAGLSLYFLLKKEAKIKMIFISLFVVLLLSQIGPFSAYAVTKNAQIAKLKESIVKIEETKDKKSPKALNLYRQISDIVRYLYRNFGIDVFAKDFTKIVNEYKKIELKKQVTIQKGNLSRSVTVQKPYFPKAPYFPTFFIQRLGIKSHESANEYGYNYDYYSIGSNNCNDAQSIKEYSYMVHLRNKDRYLYDKVKLTKIDDYKIEIKLNNLIVSKGSKYISINLESFFNALHQKYAKSTSLLSQKELTLQKKNSNFRVKILFRNIEGTIDQVTHQKRVTFDVIVLFKELKP